MRRDVARHLTAYALAAVAVSLPWPLLLVMAWDHSGGGTAGAWALGLTGAARMVPYVALSWAVGRLGDRFRRDRLVTATLVLRLGCLLGLVAAVAAGRVWLAVAAACLSVACGTPAYPTVAAAMPQLARNARLDPRRATDVLVTVECGAWAVGPALGGLLLWPPTRGWVPLAGAAMMVSSLVLVHGLRLPGPAGEVDSSSDDGVLAGVLSRPAVLRALAMVGLVNVVVSALAVILLPLSRDAWAQGDSGFGAATAALGFGALGAPVVGWAMGTGLARRRLALATMTAGVVCVAVSPGPVGAVPLLGLVGACIVVLESSSTQTIQAEMRDHHLAGTLGVADSVMVLGALVGTLLAPLLASSTGPRVAALVCAVLCAGTGVLGAGGRAAYDNAEPERAQATRALTRQR